MATPTPSPPNTVLRTALDTIQSRTSGITVIFDGDVSKQLWVMHYRDSSGADKMETITARPGKVYPTKRSGVVEHFAHFLNEYIADFGSTFLRVSDASIRDVIQKLCPKFQVVFESAPTRTVQLLQSAIEKLRLEPLKSIEVFSDASINRRDPNNPHTAGFGWVIKYDGPVEPIVGSTSEHADGVRHAEILAMLHAVRGLLRAHPEMYGKGFGRVTFSTDSKAALSLIAQVRAGVVRISASSAELNDARQIKNLIEHMDVELMWVRGHNGHLQNESADRLARMARFNEISGTGQIDKSKMIRHASNELSMQMRLANAVAA
jgi:ribonuclease HI